jgi:hypothetical protein
MPLLLEALGKVRGSFAVVLDQQNLSAHIFH